MARIIGDGKFSQPDLSKSSSPFSGRLSGSNPGRLRYVRSQGNLSFVSRMSLPVPHDATNSLLLVSEHMQIHA